MMRPMARCTIPAVYVTGRYGSWSCCGCGWTSPLVHGGAIGATVAWALHFAAMGPFLVAVDEFMDEVSA